MAQVIERQTENAGNQRQNAKPLHQVEHFAEQEIGANHREHRAGTAHHRVDHGIGAFAVGVGLGEFVGQVDHEGGAKDWPHMRFRPGHHEQRQRHGDNTVKEINRAASEPGIVAALLQRPEKRMQKRGEQRQHQRQLMPGVGALERDQPGAHECGLGGGTPGRGGLSAPHFASTNSPPEDISQQKTMPVIA